MQSQKFKKLNTFVFALLYFLSCFFRLKFEVYLGEDALLENN